MDDPKTCRYSFPDWNGCARCERTGSGRERVGARGGRAEGAVPTVPNPQAVWWCQCPEPRASLLLAAIPSATRNPPSPCLQERKKTEALLGQGIDVYPAAAEATSLEEPVHDARVRGSCSATTCSILAFRHFAVYVRIDGLAT